MIYVLYSGGYDHELVSLTEGLTALGVEVRANRQWSRRGSAALTAEPESVVRHATAIVVHSSYLALHGQPRDVLALRTGAAVLVDSRDGITPLDEAVVAEYDFVLKTQSNARIAYPANHRPWAFGFTNRILAALDSAAAERRQPVVLWNFRHKHSVRSLATTHVLPLLADRWEIDHTTESLRYPAPGTDRHLWLRTGGRHNATYYERICSAQACAAFGGYLIPAEPPDASLLLGPEPGRRWVDFARRRPTDGDRLVQWDSWRWWEALGAGCLVFHLDLDHYGAALPVMAVSMEHYCGLRISDPGAAIDLVASDPDLCRRIAERGRRWALTHYSPAAVAERFLGLLAGSDAARRTEERHGSLR